MGRTTIIVVVDGLDPEYLDHCDVPNLRQLAAQGFRYSDPGTSPEQLGAIGPLPRLS